VTSYRFDKTGLILHRLSDSLRGGLKLY